ncbi:MAG: SGNH/GDSL hydrolase family protein, partial [Streptosporangiales bacterium]|nr:SGNH/GDSL hydrolase family protein [Streptosporangiales bacterium]
MDSGKFRHIASVGSSFAAGPGIEPVADRAALRSARNYPHLLAERLGAELTDLTVSGATTATILDTPQRMRGHVFPPQIQGLPGNADLVTITAGGNDLKYALSMIVSGYAGRLSSRGLTRPLGTLLGRRGVPDPEPVDVDRAAAGLARIAEAARAKAPGARVLLVDYVTVLGPGTVPDRDVPFDAVTLDALRRLGDKVAEAFAAAAARSDAELVRVSERSRDHALGSADPWASGLPSRLRDLSSA